MALLDALHEATIAAIVPKPLPDLAQTSFIYRIFAGKIRSQASTGARERERERERERAARPLRCSRASRMGAACPARKRC